MILKVIIVSNELDLKEVSSSDKFDIYSLIDLSSVTFKSHCSPIFSLEGYETLLDSSLSCFIFEGEGVRDDTISFKHIIYKDNNDSVVALSDFLKSILLFRDSFIYLNNLDLTKDKFSVSISLSLVNFSYYESAQYLKDFFLELDDFLESIDKRFNLLFDIDIYFLDNDKHSRNLVLLNRPLRHPIYKFLNTYRKKGCNLINYSFHTYGRRLL